jgi:hypothetical protein
MPNADYEYVLELILGEIATTPKSLATICKEIPGAPNPASVYRWMSQDKSLSERYARAKHEQLQVLADEIVYLADTDRICEKVTIKADGSREVVILDSVERTKVQIDSRKWLLSKLAPAKYGDRLGLTNADGTGDATLIIKHIGSDGTD